jgi:hypothetical protein
MDKRSESILRNRHGKSQEQYRKYPIHALTLETPHFMFWNEG